MLQLSLPRKIIRLFKLLEENFQLEFGLEEVTKRQKEFGNGSMVNYGNFPTGTMVNLNLKSIKEQKISLKCMLLEYGMITQRF